LIAVLFTASSGIGLASPANAAPAYAVMNTSEYPPDGVNFRSAPDWNARVALTGYGVYAGELVRLNCWQSGTNVPRRDGGTNLIWYQADNTSRTAAAGRANSGWINAHFVNDGTGPGQVAPGVPACGSKPAPPSPPVVQTAYFSPYRGPGWPPGNAATVKNVPLENWAPGDCDTSEALNDVPGSATNLAGWSKGRLGPVYALARANSSQLQRLRTVLMVDPGSYDELSSSCDNRAVAVGYSSAKQRPGSILARWLKANGSGHLVILAADATADYRHPVNGSAHAGIQNVYFNDLRRAGTDLSRVLVCNYTQQAGTWAGRTNHQAAYLASQGLLSRPPTTTCPSLVGFAKGAAWHP
jgi:hypothetical protein